MPERTSWLAAAIDLDGRQRRRRCRAVLLQPAQDVLDVDDGVVDQLADGDGQAAQRHGVDRQAEGLEDQHGDQDRERDGRERDERSRARSSGTGTGRRRRRAPASTSTRSTLAIEVSMKVACRNWILVAVTPAGSVFWMLVELRLDRARQRDGVGGRLLLDAEDDGGLAHEAGVAALDARREVDLRDLAQQDRRGPGAWRPRGCAGPRGASVQADVADQVLAARAGRRSRRRCWRRSGASAASSSVERDVEPAHHRAGRARPGTGAPRRRSGSPARRRGWSGAAGG